MKFLITLGLICAIACFDSAQGFMNPGPSPQEVRSQLTRSPVIAGPPRPLPQEPIRAAPIQPSGAASVPGQAANPNRLSYADMLLYGSDYAQDLAKATYFQRVLRGGPGGKGPLFNNPYLLSKMDFPMEMMMF